MLIPHWPIYTGPNKDFKNSLNRMFFILNKIGNPHLKLKNVIHITGTKGKGSTALYISNILRASGKKVNTYTSPHIYECNERILLNGIQITDDELYEATEMIRFVCEKENLIEPSLFEALTCVAFFVMYKNDADFNVLEVGMGGRYDATNVFDDNPPLACVFTPIHLDHTKFLGNTIMEVAWNKSFLIKKNVKNIILSSQAIETKDVLKNVARQNNISDKNIYCYGDEYEVFYNDDIPVYECEKFDSCFPFLKPNMQGDYQLINASCAITTCLSCQKTGFLDNLSLDAINNGIKNTFNIVRMQKIESGKLVDKLPNGSIFYVDGAHNQLASHALATFIEEFKKQNDDCLSYKICVAVARTKGADNDAFLKELQHCVDLIICTRANLESIPEPPENIATSCKTLHIPYEIAYNIEEVFNKTLMFCEKQKVLLICTGSLYIARDIHIMN